MGALRYLCLSDLHLGAGYSLLTGVDAGGRIEPEQGSSTLTALAQALAQTLPALCDDTPPTLVLLGDVVDMGLSPLGAVSLAFQRFVRELMLASGRPLFAPRVLLVPGNHDHHLWRRAQDREYRQRLAAGHVDRDLIQHTTLFDQPQQPRPRCELLTLLARSEPSLGDIAFDIAYPNLGLLDAARRRCVVLHHGHYIDPLYRLISTLEDYAPRAPGTAPPPLTAGRIEARNGAWVDFLWSDLGSAGATGREATRLYQVMRDPGASLHFSHQLARLLTRQLGGALGLAGTMPVVQGITVAQLTRGLVDATFARAAESQRADYLQLMSDDDIGHLSWYLSGAVRQQLEHEGVNARELELGFVFGHTHKPFQSQLSVPGFERPVAVFNTGGWVMDQPTMTRTQGAAAVLVDDQLQLASLRLFNDPVNGSSAPVHAAGCGAPHERDNPLLTSLTAALERNTEAWATFSRSAVAAAQQHARQLLDEFFAPQDREVAL